MKVIELYNDHFQNFKSYSIPKAQLIIADVPYNLGANAYASNPAWYVDGDNKNGESALAGKQFFDTDKDFRPAEFMHFCSQMLRKDRPVKDPQPTEGKGKRTCGAACMILFCPFEQIHYYIELAGRYGLKKYIPQILLGSSSQGQYENRGQLRIRSDSLPGSLAEIQQRGPDDLQLLRLGTRYGHPENPPDAETRAAFGTIDRDFYRQGRRGYRSLCRKRNYLAGCGPMRSARLWFRDQEDFLPRCRKVRVVEDTAKIILTMTHASLFSGIGGFDLAAEWAA